MDGRTEGQRQNKENPSSGLGGVAIKIFKMRN